MRVIATNKLHVIKEMSFIGDPAYPIKSVETRNNQSAEKMRYDDTVLQYKVKSYLF